MNIQIATPPAVEPITLAELQMQLGISSGTIASDSTLYAAIAPGSHPITTGYTLFSQAIEVLGHTAVVYLQPVNNGTGATVDCKIQECDTSTGTWTDFAGGAFTQVTEANDTVIQEISYTGTKKYIRTAAKTLVQACEFGTSVMVWEPNVSEDDYLTELIVAARMDVENDTGRKLITQTLDYYIQDWPSTDRIKLPYGNLQSVTSITYTDYAGTVTTLTQTTDYTVELNGDQCGFAVLAYGKSWPSVSLHPSNPIAIRFVCGYGSTGASVPVTARQAIKRRCINLYMNRGDDIIGQTVSSDKTYERLCNNIGRLYDMDFL
jgi:uncharacterized phiE125 gp8 family phage protein